MATIVHALVNGFSDAASGTVEFYQRGTATPSTEVYSDVNGQTAVAHPHNLNGSGRIVRYVEEIVDVVVKNAAGATVASWTEVVDGRTVRLESTAFTGSNPAGGGGIISAGMTTLHAGLALYATSQGADDAKVNINGAEYTLQEALGSAGSVFFNVQTGYGATGDGSTDDTSAIQAAMNAADSAGGGVVFFPVGTYKITGSLSTGASVAITLMGAGSNTTRIIQHTTGLSDGWLKVNTSFVAVSGLFFTSVNSTITGSCVEVPSGPQNVSFEACQFGNNAGTCIKTNANDVTLPATFDSCRFFVSSTSGSVTTGGGIKPFNSCVFDVSVVPTAGVFDGVPSLSGCTVRLSSTSGGVVVAASGADIFVSACSVLSSNTSGTNTLGLDSSGLVYLSASRFEQAAGGTFNISAGASLREAACRFAGSGTYTITDGLTSNGTHSMFRNMRRDSQTIAGTSVTPNAECGQIVVTHSSGASLAVANPANSNFSYGTPLTIHYANNTGGNITPTWGTAYAGVPATAVVTANRALYHFINDGNANWVCVTTNPVISYT